VAEPFLGELRLMSFDFPPKGWALCNGQLLPINQNQALFALLGTQFGGNGQTNFALPDLRGITPIHQGDGFTMGQLTGQAVHTVTISELPQHIHFVNANTSTAPDPGGETPAGNKRLAASAPANLYAAAGNFTTMNPGSIGTLGGSQAHENRQPYLTLSFCIALQGIFPSRN
jgi:microcystin-dependent protein